GQGEVAEDDAYVVAVGLGDLAHGLRGAAAEGALEVGELDDGDRSGDLSARRPVVPDGDAGRLEPDLDAGRAAQRLDEVALPPSQGLFAHTVRDLPHPLVLAHAGKALARPFIEGLELGRGGDADL